MSYVVAMRSLCRGILLSFLIAGWVAMDQLSAAEPYEAFLDALRRERYHDLAVVYLDGIESRPEIPEAFRASIPYQRALLAFSAIEEEPDLKRRLQRLDAAHLSTDKALATVTDPDQQVKLRQLGLDALAGKARLLALQASHAKVANAKQLRADADAVFSQAIAAAEAVASDLKSKLETMAKLPRDQQDPTLRENWRLAYVAAQIAIPTLQLESADLIRESGPAYRDRIRSTADHCAKLLEKYSAQRPDAYLPLTLLSGRCYQALEDYERALTFYSEILENDLLPDSVTSFATQLSMECWASRTEGKFDKAIAAGESWLSAHARASPADAAPVRVALARSLLQSATASKEEVRPSIYARARALLVEASRAPGPWRQDAQQLLGTIPASSGSVDLADEYKTFEEAKLAGDAALGNLQAAEQTKSLIAMRADQTSTEEQPPESDEEPESSEDDLLPIRASAIAAYRRALDLRTPETPVDDVTQTQFVLSYLLYEEGEYYDAAVLAEFIARERGESVQARNSVRTAIAAWSRLLEQSSGNSKFAEDSLRKIAEYAANRWPQDEEGQDAIVTVVRLLIGQGRVTDAQEYLDRIPDSSPWRGAAEISTGMALFRKHQTAASSNGEGAPVDAERLWEVAQELLQSGLQRVESTDATPMPVLGHLTLAQMQLDRGSPATALELLHDSHRGPFTLVQQDSPITRDPALADLILQTELRARLLLLSQGNVASENRDVQPVIESLASVVGDSPAAKQRLVTVLIRLANELRDRVRELPMAQRTAAAEGLDAVYTHAMNATQDADVLNWIGHTLHDASDLLDGADTATAERRERLLSLAATALERALQTQHEPLDSQTRLQTVVRLASVKRRQNDYRGAIPLFAEVLASNPNLLNVQFEAAHTYQEGGAYQYAVKGGRPDPKTQENVIWGWEKISAMLARQMKRGDSERDKYESLFHEARYQIAKCRYQQALKVNGPVRRDYLESARRAIETTMALYPELGGPDQKAQYDSLLQEIEQALANT